MKSTAVANNDLDMKWKEAMAWAQSYEDKKIAQLELGNKAIYAMDKLIEATNEAVNVLTYEEAIEVLKIIGDYNSERIKVRTSMLNIGTK